MKSTTYIAEITTKKNEKYMSEGRNSFACSPACLLASCHLRNFLREFTEKCFAVFDQSSCAIYLMWYRPLLFFWGFSSIILFMAWLQDSSQIKGMGYIFMSSIVCWCSAEVIFFQLKAEYLVFHFLDLDGTILNLIKPKIKKCWNFHRFIKFSLFYPLYCLNLDSDLSVNNIVWLGLADTNIGSQDPVKKVIELTE